MKSTPHRKKRDPAHELNYKTDMKNNNGLTLIELMGTLAIVAIMLGLASAGLNQYVRSNRTITQTNDLIAALQLARSEAVKRNGHVYICASATATAATPECDSNNWHDGWVVFVDTDRDAVDAGGAFTGSPPAANDIILHTHTGLKGETTVTSVNFTNSNYIRYRADGRADSNGSLVFCDSEDNTLRARAINISLSGLITAATDTASDNIVNLEDGSNASC